MNLFCLGCVGLETAGNAIVKAHSEREQQVGVLDSVVDPCLAMHSHHAHVQEVRGWKSSES